MFICLKFIYNKLMDEHSTAPGGNLFQLLIELLLKGQHDKNSQHVAYELCSCVPLCLNTVKLIVKQQGPSQHLKEWCNHFQVYILYGAD